MHISFLCFEKLKIKIKINASINQKVYSLFCFIHWLTLIQPTVFILKNPISLQICGQASIFFLNIIPKEEDYGYYIDYLITFIWEHIYLKVKKTSEKCCPLHPPIWVLTWQFLVQYGPSHCLLALYTRQWQPSNYLFEEWKFVSYSHNHGRRFIVCC